MATRAIRGATQLAEDSESEMISAVTELLTEIMDRNGLTTDAFISILFTSTPDLVSCFPAKAARKLDLAEVPLMCAQEIPVPGALERVVRIMAHVDTPQERADVQHVFLRGAQVLRQDLVR